MNNKKQIIIRAEFIDKIELLIRELNGNPVQLLQKVGLTPALLRHPDNYIPYYQVAELLELCAKQLDSPLFGIQLAQVDNLAKGGVLSFSLSLEQTLLGMYEHSQEHSYLQNNALKRELQIENHRAFWKICQLDSELDNFPQIHLCHLQRTYNFIVSRLPSSCDRNEIKIHTKIPMPSEQNYNNQNMIFNDNHYSISIPESWLEYDLNHISQYAENISSLLLEQWKSSFPDNLITMIKTTIINLLPTGECSIDIIAKTLDCSVRTIQQQLQNNNTSYSELLKDSRLIKACELLLIENITITEISFQVGFSNISTFSRKFKEWTSYSPKQWRANNLNKPNQ